MQLLDARNAGLMRERQLKSIGYLPVSAFGHHDPELSTSIVSLSTGPLHVEKSVIDMEQSATPASAPPKVARIGGRGGFVCSSVL